MELSHGCELPRSVDEELCRAGQLHWTCDECGAIYSVQLEQSPQLSWKNDYSSSVRYTDANGLDREHCTQQVYSRTPGRARIIYRAGGILGLDYRDTVGLEVTKDFPPEDLARLGETRASSPTLEEILATVEDQRAAVKQEEAAVSRSWWKR